MANKLVCIVLLVAFVGAPVFSLGGENAEGEGAGPEQALAAADPFAQAEGEELSETELENVAGEGFWGSLVGALGMGVIATGAVVLTGITGGTAALIIGPALLIGWGSGMFATSW